MSFCMMVFAKFIWGFVREKRYGLCNIFVLLFEFELCSWYMCLWIWSYGQSQVPEGGEGGSGLCVTTRKLKKTDALTYLKAVKDTWRFWSECKFSFLWWQRYLKEWVNSWISRSLTKKGWISRSYQLCEQDKGEDIVLLCWISTANVG